MISPRFPVAVTIAAIVSTAPVAAQRMSDSYEFLKAVREADGTKVTEMLDKPGSNIVNTRDFNTGETGLHIVAKRGDAQYIGFLLSRGANANAQDGRGNTAVMLAANGNFAECVDRLIRQRANLNLANASGETPLIRAVQNRNLDIARMLLTAGANPDQRDTLAGMSARDYATRDTRSPAIARLLAEAKSGAARAVSGPKF